MSVRTLPFTLNRAAEWYPDGEAFVQGFGGDERRYTFAEANRAARRVAHSLRELGVGHGDRVALLGPSTAEHAVVHYACTKLGAVPAAVHRRETPAVLAEMIDRIDAAALVFHPDVAGTAAEVVDRADLRDAVVALDGVTDTTVGTAPGFARSLAGLAAGRPTVEPDADVTPGDMAYVNFSSGTTGRPKALVVRHGQAVEMTHVEAGGTTEQARILNAFGPSFMGWEDVTLTNVHTAATTVFHAGDVERIPALVAREDLTRVSLITTVWRLLREAGHLEGGDWDSVESAGISGEPVNPELFRAIRAHVTEAVGTGYGLTETMGSGTALKAHQVDEDTIGSVGKPLPSCDVRVVEPGSRDPDATVPTGETGEVVIRGPSVCSERLGAASSDDDPFHPDGWVFTGDRGYIEGGFLYLQGRGDSMIISGGINVYPERVETAIEEHPQVVACGVVGVPDDRWGERVEAYVMVEGDLTAGTLDEWCRDGDAIADYQRPRKYTFIDELPRNNAGKLDRRALRERALDDVEE